MDYRKLGKTGLNVSVLGFGASPFGGVYGRIDDSIAAQCVRRALELGINYFDVAPYYGMTVAETRLGHALAQSGFSRDSFYVATKVGRYGPTRAEFDVSARRVSASIDESLARLQLDYIDVMQCHDIEFVDVAQIIEETIPALQAARNQGKIRFIGITGLPLQLLQRVVAATDVDVVLSYCRHTLQNSSLADFLPAFHQKELGVINASPLAMGLLTQAAPPAWHPAPSAIQTCCAEARRFCAEKGSDLAKLALQFSVRHPGIHTTLTGMSSPADVEQNARVIAEPLDLELLHEIEARLRRVHNQIWNQGIDANYPDCARCRQRVGREGYIMNGTQALCFPCGKQP